MARGETVTVITRTVTGRDQRGNDVYDDEEVDVDGVVLWPDTGESEDVQGRDLVTGCMRALIPPNAPVQVAATSRVLARGLLYEVSAAPDDWRSPFTSRRPGTEVRLTRITG